MHIRRGELPAIGFASNRLRFFSEQFHMLTIATDENMHHQQRDVVIVETIVPANGTRDTLPAHLKSLGLHGLFKSLDCPL